MATPPTSIDPSTGAPGGLFGRYTRLVVGAGVTIVAMLIVTPFSGGSDPGRAAAPAAVAATGATSAVASTRTTTATTGARNAATTTAPAPATTDPGALPQTEAEPGATSPTFVAHVDALWAAITADDPGRAMPFFFPLKAYEQVKAISDPDGDWNTRLVAAYREDIHSWHSQLGPDAATATFVSVAVPDTAQWIKPGVEFNKGSYWRVYGATLAYQVGGRSGTFTVASMISWRGEWYVVHLASIR